MRCYSSLRSAFVLSLFLIPACGKYVPPTMLVLDSSETHRVHWPNASMAALERRDFAPYEGRSLAEAVAQLRPDWLRSSPVAHVDSDHRSPVLYVNNVALGEITGMRTIPSEAAIEVRLLSQSEAWARYGPVCRCPRGAIVVRTRSDE